MNDACTTKLLPVPLKQSSTGETDRQASVFFLLEQMAEFSQELKANAEGMLPILHTALAGAMPMPMPMPVRLAALKAALALVSSLQAEDELVQNGKAARADALKPAAAHMVATAVQVVQAKVRARAACPNHIGTTHPTHQRLCSHSPQDPSESQAVLELLAEVVDVAPKFLIQQMPTMLSAFGQVRAEADASPSIHPLD
jgi:hypothetical protein